MSRCIIWSVVNTCFACLQQRLSRYELFSSNGNDEKMNGTNHLLICQQGVEVFSDKRVLVDTVTFPDSVL